MPTANMTTPNGLYFDSALIAKFYLNEAGREIVRELTRKAGSVVASAIAVAEVSAAFHRKFREGAVDAMTFKALQGQFQHDLKSGLWKMIPVSDALIEDARSLFAGLSPSVFLRSLDTLHLVTAKAEKFDRIHTNDRHLIEACAKAGLRAVNPFN